LVRPEDVTKIPSPTGNTVHWGRQMLANHEINLTGVALVRCPHTRCSR